MMNNAVMPRRQLNGLVATAQADGRSGVVLSTLVAQGEPSHSQYLEQHGYGAFAIRASKKKR